MSIIDPVRLRKERELARQGSTGAAVGLVVGGLVMLLAGGALGYSTGGQLASFRGGALDGHFVEGGLPSVPSAAALVAMPVGILGIIAGVFVMTGAAKAYTGHVLDFPVVGPATLGLVGFGAGLAFDALQWGAPKVVGRRTDPYHDDEPWSGADWFWFHLGEWLPLVGAGLALLAIATAVLARRRKAAARRRLDRLLLAGRRTVGEVTQIPKLTEGSALLAPWTVRFVDAAGIERWAQLHGRFPREDLPVVGDLVTVLHDPIDPSDQRRIYVGGLEAVSAHDFLRWRL